MRKGHAGGCPRADVSSNVQLLTHMQAGGAETKPTQRDARPLPDRTVTVNGCGAQVAVNAFLTLFAVCRAMVRYHRPSIAVPLGVALLFWGVGAAFGANRIAAPGLWQLAQQAGIPATVTPLFAIVAVGLVLVVVVQSIARSSIPRPSATGVALAMVGAALLLPEPATLLWALLPIAVAARVGRLAAIALLASITIPPIGVAALMLAAIRLAGRLREASQAPVARTPAGPLRPA